MAKILCAGTCGRMIYHNKSSLPEGQAMCRICRKSVPKGTAKQCAVCCVQFYTRKDKVLCCSKECGQKYRADKRRSQPGYKGEKARNAEKTAKRRVRLSSQMIEAVDPQIVGERDNWECKLCLLPVDPHLSGKDRMGASLDHIVPLSRGGEHSYANVQLAHLGCNSSKGNKGDGMVVDVAGFWVYGPRPPRVCSACGQYMTHLTVEWRCYQCHPLRGEGLMHGERVARAREAATMRRSGASWSLVAVVLGYANAQAAYASAVYQAKKDGKYDFGRNYTRKAG